MKAKITDKVRSFCARLSTWFKRGKGAAIQSGAASTPHKSAA